MRNTGGFLSAAFRTDRDGWRTEELRDMVKQVERVVFCE